MTTIDMTTQERALAILKELPPDKAEEVLDFAQYLADKTEEEEWEKRLASAADRPKFRAMVEQVREDIAQGKTEPLDFDRL